MLRLTDAGFYCEAGGFYVDPWRPVERAVITHAHGDHVAWGSGAYLRRGDGRRVLRGAARRPTPSSSRSRYGERRRLGGVRVSLHPGGTHPRLGAGAHRASRRGVGRLRRLQDRSRSDLRAVRAGALPHLRHRVDLRPADLSLAAAGARSSRRSTPGGAPTATRARRALLFGYALGKAQRLLAGLDPAHRPDLHARRRRAARPRLSRGGRGAAADDATPAPSDGAATRAARSSSRRRRPSVAVGPALRRRRPPRSPRAGCGCAAPADAARVDRGFVLSDHVDWPSLLGAIEATGAGRVWVTHGYHRRRSCAGSRERGSTRTRWPPGSKARPTTAEADAARGGDQQ